MSKYLRDYYDEPDDRALVAVPLMLLALPATWPVWPYIFWRSLRGRRR